MLINIFYLLSICTAVIVSSDNYVDKDEILELDDSENFFSKKVRKRNADVEDQQFVEPKEEDFIDAAHFGIQAMNDLYKVKEPKLHSMGLFLGPDNPAFFVAAFNQPSQEAEQLAKYGYASLEATKRFKNKFPDLSRQALHTKQSQANELEQQCPKRGKAICTPASKRYRTSDGSCNNLKEKWWGSAMSNMQRFLHPIYEDGIESIRKSVTGSFLPSARRISDYIHEERNIPLDSITHMLMQWGQFIDHDVTATAQSSAFMGSVPQCCLNGGLGFQPPEFMHPECMPIEVPTSDRHLGELKVRCLEFVRSAPAPREDCEFGPREHFSQVTSFIDASTIYSSSAQQSDSLRIFRNGLLQYGKLQSRKPALPRADPDHCKLGSLSTNCFKAGDGRLSEQPALISLHVIFLRLHNRIATQLAALNSHWTDERIFQEARKIVGAIVQHITYREFLPIVLGHEILKIFDIEVVSKGYYEGYDRSVNPNIANEFSTAAYRFGHSLVQNSFVRFDRSHKPLANNVSIHEEFSNPGNLESVGSVDRILLGLVNQPAQRRDEFISKTLTNHLFQTPGFPFGMDLASINIQRGRDHGIPPFADWRVPCGLRPIRKWSDLERIMTLETARKFKDIYSSVQDIDLFPAGLAEKPVPGGLVGPTFACIIAQQFRNLRKGDRFWYENPFPESSFTLSQLEQIRRTTLAKVMCHNLDSVDNIQPFAMLAPDDNRNKRLPCKDSILSWINLDPWIENRTQQRSPSESDDKDENNNNNIKSKTNETISDRKARRRGPVKTKINQQNKIVIQRPLGSRENLTIVINNNAVHSPIFIRDSVNGSNLNINQISNSGEQINIPEYDESTIQEPVPTQNPYHPQIFYDPYNPNPPSSGYITRPPVNNPPSNVKPPGNGYFSEKPFTTTSKVPSFSNIPTNSPPTYRPQYSNQESINPRPSKRPRPPSYTVNPYIPQIPQNPQYKRNDYPRPDYPQESQNYNSNGYTQGSPYLTTHTTISDIMYVSSEKNPVFDYSADPDLPRPLRP